MIDKAFVKAHKAELTDLYEYYDKQLLKDTIPFWEPRIVDKEFGGYFNCFDRKGSLYKDIKPGWFVGRNIFTFSNLYNVIEKKQEWLGIAAAGVEWMEKHSYKGNGRFVSSMTRAGKDIDSKTNIFNDAFTVKGYYEYLVALGDKRTEKQMAFATEITDKLFSNAKNTELLESEGLPAGFICHAVNFIMLITALESLQLFGNRYVQELNDRMHNAMYVFANDEHKAVFEFVGTDGKPLLKDEGRVMDPGHALESCWFAMQAGIETKNEKIVKRAEEVLDWIIDRGYDEEYGGFILLLDVENDIPEDAHRTQNYSGTIADCKDKVWWAQSEGLYTLALSALVNGNERHFSYFMKLHEYVDMYFRDHEYGEWYSILSRKNEMLLDHKGFEGKGPYHIPRCLVLIRNLFKNCL